MASNEHGQPVGEDLDGWRPPPPPSHIALTGPRIALEPLHRARHAIPLFHTLSRTPEEMWTYLPLGPFQDAAELGQLFDAMSKSADVLPYAFIVGDEALGFGSFLRIQPDVGVIEIGWLALSPHLQQSAAATEALALMLGHAFDSGYRRVEWKCDALNERSRSAAARLGFTFEGVFRKATH